MPEQFDAVATILRQAVEAHAFPAAAIEVGNHAGTLWSDCAGAFTFDPYAPSTTPETIFDLASLTKVIAATAVTMRAVDAGRLTLDDRVADWLPHWRGTDRTGVTIRQLLTHSSGLTAYLPLFRDYTGRFEFETAICTLPLEYEPGTQSIYSDLGFILLGFILEDGALRASGRPSGAFDPEATLSHQFDRLRSFFTPDPLTFNPPRAWRSKCAPTEVDR